MGKPKFIMEAADSLIEKLQALPQHRTVYVEAPIYDAEDEKHPHKWPEHDHCLAIIGVEASDCDSIMLKSAVVFDQVEAIKLTEQTQYIKVLDVTRDDTRQVSLGYNSRHPKQLVLLGNLPHCTGITFNKANAEKLISWLQQQIIGD